MKILLALIILLTLTPLVAQNHFLGVQGGATFSYLHPSISSNETKSKTGVMFGLNYQYQFKNKFQIGVDALYFQRKYSLEYSNVNSNVIQIEELSEYSYNYISFPIKAGYSIGDKLSGFLNIGLVPYLFLDAERIVTPSQGPKERTNDVMSSEVDLDLALLVEIGASYKVKDQVLLFVLCNYQHGYSQVPGHGITTGLGLRYKLKNRQ